MQKVILIHGNGGSTGNDNWFPWLKEKLTELGVECIAPNFPDPITAKSSLWLPFLKNDLNADENTILVGHSSGALAAMRYAETNRINGSVLVGVAYTDLDDENEKASGYFDTPWRWQAIKDNQEWIMIFASPSDPYIPIEDPRHVKTQLSADYYELPDQGHFGGSGPRVKLEFPELLHALKQKLGLS